MDTSLQASQLGSRFWVQIGEIDYQRQFVAARKKLDGLLGVEVVKGWMDRDDEDEVAEAVFIVDVEADQVAPFKRQAGRLGWACRLVETLVRPCCSRCGSEVLATLEDDATRLVSCDACGLLEDRPIVQTKPRATDEDLAAFVAQVEIDAARMVADLVGVVAGGHV
jgi:DNA-directed RNA polymerase subunit RPC12/RpoP